MTQKDFCLNLKIFSGHLTNNHKLGFQGNSEVDVFKDTAEIFTTKEKVEEEEEDTKVDVSIRDVTKERVEAVKVKEELTMVKVTIMTKILLGTIAPGILLNGKKDLNHLLPGTITAIKPPIPMRMMALIQNGMIGMTVSNHPKARKAKIKARKARISKARVQIREKDQERQLKIILLILQKQEQRQFSLPRISS